MIHHLTRATRHLIFWGLMALAVGLTAIRVTLTIIDIYKEDLATTISRQLSAPVSIGKLVAGMRGFRPELVLKNVNVQSTDQPQKNALEIAEIRLNINLLHSLSQQQILASSWITLVGAKLTLNHQRDGRISILGLKNDPNQPPPFWLLQTAQIEVLQSRIGWQEEQDQTQLLFKDVDLSLKNTQDGQQHWLNLVSTLPKQYGEILRLSMHLKGNFLAPQGLNGLIYADIKNLQLANPYTATPKDGGSAGSVGSNLNKRLPLDLAVTGGHGDLKLWSQWQQSQVQEVTGMMQLFQAQLQRPNQSPLLISKLLNRFNLIRHQQQWELAVDQLTFKNHATQLADARLSALVNINPGNDSQASLEQLQIQADNIDLHHVTEFSTFFSAVDTAPVLKTLRGQLKNFRLMLQPDSQQFTLKGDFEKVGLDANSGLPGFTNLNGHLEGNQQSGRIDLNSQDSALDLPEVFAKPLPLDALKAHFTWQQTLEGWQFASPLVALTVPDIKVNSRLKFGLDRENFGVTIDLTSAFSGMSDINAFARYLPVGLMGKDAANWLNQAFLKGKIKPTGVILKGKLADFPFRNQQGVFQIALDIIDTDLNFTPGWEPLRKLNAEVLFNQEGLQVTAKEASALDFKFSQLAMQLKSFELSDYLTVSGEGNGDLHQILDYLQQSPLKSKLTSLQEVINPHGATGLKLDLQIPLIDQGAFKLNGSAQLQDVDFDVLSIKLPVTQTHGKIEFNEQGLTLGSLKAQALGNVVGSNLKGDADNLHIEVLGHTHMTDLQKQFKQPLWDYAQGETDYLLKLNLPNSSNQHAQLHLNSELTGLALTLPDILAKPVEQARSFDLHINFNDQATLLTLNYAQQLQAALSLNLKQKQIRSGQVLLGDGQLEALPAHGMQLNINLKRFSLADWLIFAETTPTDGGSAGIAGSHSGSDETSNSKPPLFDKIKLNTEHLLWQQQDTGNLQLSMQQEQRAWQIIVDSPLMKGHIRKPFNVADDLPMILDLDYLDLSGLSKLKNSKPEPTTAKRLPLFTINSTQVYWDKVDLGKLALETRRIINGIEFTKLTLKNPSGLLELTGSWIFNAAEQLTTTLGKLTMQKFGDFVNQLGITDDLKETQALIEFAVNWAGAPQNFALEKLDGRVDVDLKNGRILSIEPGFGRVLGFLAMEQWGRRLRLDFSDMIAQGLTFNSIVGHFDLHQGNAVTDRLKIDAIPATISISGSSYLPEHSLNHHVTVLPKSSAAVPIAGTIVDKVLTFAVETLTGTSQEGFLLGSEYKLLGKWQNPEVTQLHDNDGLLPKTWSGLTDFSWFPNTP